MLADSPFLHAPLVYPNEQPVAAVLAALVEEMERRYALMSETRADTLADHIRRTGQPIPRIFCVCDEYADVIAVDTKQRRAIELQIMRLGAKARAAGIHLMLAVQHPSSEIVRGALNANIPARIGLKVQKALYSHMLLNEAGAESLLGKGDLLFKRGGELLRLQAPFLPPEEQEAIFRVAPFSAAA
jgi:DNA segregation ATPase FtsK/SpoIIIE-like protein